MEEERLKEALRQVIREKGRAKKNQKPTIKKVAAIGGAIIISLTITIHSDSLKKNQTASTNDLLNIKKTANLTKTKINYPIGENYSFENQMYEYLDVVNTSIGGREWQLNKNPDIPMDRIDQYTNIGQI